MLTGLLIIGIGILFWRTNGLVGVPELVSLDTQASLQNAAQVLTNPIFDILAILVITAVILAIWFRYRSRAEDSASEDQPQFLGTDTFGANLISPDTPHRKPDRQESL